MRVKSKQKLLLKQPMDLQHLMLIILYKNGIMVIPDILANGGGVTVSYFEWLQNLRREDWKEDEVNQRLDRNISKAFSDVYETHDQYTVNMRKASPLFSDSRGSLKPQKSEEMALVQK